MSDYSSLKATINANVKANNNHEITGSIMNSVLNAMVDSLGAGYQFMGVATPTNPGSAQTPDYKCFYLATTPGTYTYLGGLVVADGEVALLKYDSSWTKEVTGIASADKLNQLGQEIYARITPDLFSVVKLYKGGYYDGGYVDVLKRVHFGAINSPFDVQVATGYQITYVSKFSRNANGNLSFVSDIPVFNNSYSVNELDSYVYIVTIGRLDELGIDKSEYDNIVLSFSGKVDIMSLSLTESIENIATLDDSVQEIQSIIGEDVIYNPNNPWEDFSMMQSGRNSIFANLFRANKVCGFIVKISAPGYVKYGIVKNVTGHPVTELGQIYIPNQGLNTIYIDSEIILQDDEYFYIVPVLNDIHIYRINTNGVGMIEGDYDSAFQSWEMAYSVIEKENEISKLKKETSRQIGTIKYGEIILPDNIYIAKKGVNLNDGVNGECECNLFWDSIANVESGDKSIYFDTFCDVGRNTDRGYKLSSNIAGNYTLKIVARETKSRQVISSKIVNIHFVNNSVGTGEKNILMIGDSRHVWYKGYEQGGANANHGSDGLAITMKTKELLSANSGASFNFLGTKVSDIDQSVKNLSQSGWQIASAINAINNAGGIRQYIEESCGAGSGATLDFCTFMFGVNDIMEWSPDNTGLFDKMVAKINSVISNAVTLVNMIHSVYPLCNIIVVLEPTTCGTQDGFGYYGGTIGVQQHLESEYALKAYRKALISEFSKTQYSPYVTLSSAGLWCDRTFGFPYYNRKVNERTSITKNVNLDCVHPHNEGMFQIADGIYSTILALL